MGNIRFNALQVALSRQPLQTELDTRKVSEYFGELVFNQASMKMYLSNETFEELTQFIKKNEKIPRIIANQVAASMKAWAISKNATHYAHWFHPLTGATAEKHESFFTTLEGKDAIENFQGEQLIQQEPDASSFPSGGLRNTFEARGYTAWDPTSPAFILNGTLFIPSIFVSYSGESLDYKAPLLKAITAIDKASVKVCKLFNTDIERVKPVLGWEQEYFAIDSALYNARPDLILTGRTLFGHSSPKDQQLEDHYFGVIPDRIITFMKDLETEAYKLGIPIKTRHNEVAPNQFECTPIYEELNLSIDHNQLFMHLLEKVSKKHNLTILLHEKPFAAINGSGKHNNWSIITNTGDNLFKPTDEPKKNLRFLTFLVNTIKAVHNYSDLLRASIASPGNDLRLGASEAPPAIISIYLGSYLTKILDELESGNGNTQFSKEFKRELNLQISKIPEIMIDATDRNRTSPFAFTGNKFEFRAIGSSANCANAMIVLNTILAEQLHQFYDDVNSLIDNNIDSENAIYTVLKEYIRQSKNILFEGNNYSQEWAIEAEKRRLPNVKSTPDALQSYIKEHSIELFERNNVFTAKELHSRYHIGLENYVKKIQIEARVMGDIAINHIIPTAIKYQNILLENTHRLIELFGNDNQAVKSQIDTIQTISDHIHSIKENVEKMVEARKKGNAIEDIELKASIYNREVLPYFEIIRRDVDKLELMIDDELWTLPKYRELLFIK